MKRALRRIRSASRHARASKALVFAQLLVVLLAAVVPSSRAAPIEWPVERATLIFDRANQWYEQGQYTNAASAYEAILRTGHRSPAVFFNLGNAYAKANEPGRAIAAYRHGLALAPRDSGLKFNLAFVRRQIASQTPPRPFWRRFLEQLTLGEWTLVATSVYWVFMGLLLARELSVARARIAVPWLITAGTLAILTLALLLLALGNDRRRDDAVVVVPDAIARYGPLAEAQVAFQLRNGAELRLLGQKEVLLGSRRERWYRVEDSSGRIGWIRADQLMVI